MPKINNDILRLLHGSLDGVFHQLIALTKRGFHLPLKPTHLNIRRVHALYVARRDEVDIETLFRQKNRSSILVMPLRLHR